MQESSVGTVSPHVCLSWQAQGVDLCLGAVGDSFCLEIIHTGWPQSRVTSVCMTGTCGHVGSGIACQRPWAIWASSHQCV